jgi:hypothetical protein
LKKLNNLLPDPNGVGEDMRNYIPMIRPADILLTKAEALNNSKGLNEESFVLIDSVRNRSGLANLDPTLYTNSQNGWTGGDLGQDNSCLPLSEMANARNLFALLDRTQ